MKITGAIKSVVENSTKMICVMHFFYLIATGIKLRTHTYRQRITNEIQFHIGLIFVATQTKFIYCDAITHIQLFFIGRHGTYITAHYRVLYLSI